MIGLGQHLRDGQLALSGPERQAADITLRARQAPRAAVAAADPRRRDELANVLEGPPVERRVLPVAERHERRRRERRHSGHQLVIITRRTSDLDH